MQGKEHKAYAIDKDTPKWDKFMLEFNEITKMPIVHACPIAFDEFGIDFRNPKINKMDDDKTKDKQPTINHVPARPRTVRRPIVFVIRFSFGSFVLDFKDKAHHKMKDHAKDKHRL